MFCGINPGVMSSSSGHHFAHRSNHFYPSLHLAGITSERMKPEQDVDFPKLRPLSLGLTNLAGRPTAEGSELLPSELIAGVPILIDKVKRWKPRTVCFVGKGISEAFIKGLKQAGAIDGGSSRKKRDVLSAKPAKGAATETTKGVKVEEKEMFVSDASDIGKIRSYIDLDLPLTVLCAAPPPAVGDQEVKAEQGSSPKKTPSSPQKKIYKKDSAKDDTGYGVLPICVPHTRSTNRPLSSHDVTLFFVTPSSSARVTTHFLDDKARILSTLRLLVEHLQTKTTAVTQPSINVKLEEEDSLSSASAVVARATKTIRLEVVDVDRFVTA